MKALFIWFYSVNIALVCYVTLFILYQSIFCLLLIYFLNEREDTKKSKEETEQIREIKNHIMFHIFKSFGNKSVMNFALYFFNFIRSKGKHIWLTLNSTWLSHKFMWGWLCCGSLTAAVLVLYTLRVGNRGQCQWHSNEETEIKHTTYVSIISSKCRK